MGAVLLRRISEVSICTVRLIDRDSDLLSSSSCRTSLKTSDEYAGRVPDDSTQCDVSLANELQGRCRRAMHLDISLKHGSRRNVAVPAVPYTRLTASDAKEKEKKKPEQTARKAKQKGSNITYLSSLLLNIFNLQTPPPKSNSARIFLRPTAGAESKRIRSS